MVDYFDIPPGTVINCPDCGTKNSRTDSQCTKCDADLSKVRAEIASKFRTQMVKGVDASGKILTREELGRRAEIAKSKGFCKMCGGDPQKMFGIPHGGPCSFCGATMCRACMQNHHVNLKNPMFKHMVKFGLEIFPGVETSAYNFMTGLTERYFLLQPGYYLCRDCMSYLQGPEFFKFAKEYYEKTGRMEDLADLYEAQGRLDDARDARLSAKGRSASDLNKLIDKIRDGGLAVPYKCPSCGANIQVDKDTNPNGLRFCSYCGTAVNIEALMRAIESGLN